MKDAMTGTGASASPGQGRWLLAGLGRAVGVAVLSGVIAGLLVGGLGSRLVMRIVALTAPEKVGFLTDAGNRVGEITLAGTLELVLFAGLFSGIGGGSVYAALQPWLGGLRRWKGPGFGLLLLGVFGSAVIEPGNHDFRAFGSPLLNVLLFAGLFLLFGLVLGLVADRLERAAPGLPPQGPATWRTFGALGLVGACTFLALLAAGMGVLASIRAATGHSQDELFLPGVVLLCVTIPGLTIQAVLGRSGNGWGWPVDLSERTLAAAASGAALAVPMLVGLIMTLVALLKILKPGF